MDILRLCGRRSGQEDYDGLDVHFVSPTRVISHSCSSQGDAELVMNSMIFKVDKLENSFGLFKAG